KIFGYDNFRNEIVWYYYNKYSAGKNALPRAHDVILFYSKQEQHKPRQLREQREEPVKQLVRVNIGGVLKNARDEKGNLVYRESTDKKTDDVWRIPALQPASKEFLGYPTQKNPAIFERVISQSSNEGDV